MPFARTNLPYGFGDLTPVYTAGTVTNLYNNLHQGFVNDGNAALGDLEVARNTGNYSEIAADQLKLSKGACGTTLYNAFWDCMGPNGPANPSGSLASQIDADFGSLAKMKAQFEAAANSVNGNGFAFVGWSSTADQLLVGITPDVERLGQWGTDPIIAINLYNQAWTTSYPNDRPAYVSAWWGVVDWARVQVAFDAVK